MSRERMHFLNIYLELQLIKSQNLANQQIYAEETLQESFEQFGGLGLSSRSFLI